MGLDRVCKNVVLVLGILVYCLLYDILCCFFALFVMLCALLSYVISCLLGASYGVSLFSSVCGVGYSSSASVVRLEGL